MMPPPPKRQGYKGSRLAPAAAAAVAAATSVQLCTSTAAGALMQHVLRPQPPRQGGRTAANQQPLAAAATAAAAGGGVAPLPARRRCGLRPLPGLRSAAAEAVSPLSLELDDLYFRLDLDLETDSPDDPSYSATETAAADDAAAAAAAGTATGLPPLQSPFQLPPMSAGLGTGNQGIDPLAGLLEAAVQHPGSDEPWLGLLRVALEAQGQLTLPQAASLVAMLRLLA